MQRLTHCDQHLSGEAKRGVQGLANHQKGCVLFLKRLKYIFGKKSKIAQAHLSKVTRGKQINGDDDAGLLEYFNTVNIIKQLGVAS